MKKFALIASISGLLAVALGAFAAHGLQGKVEPGLLDVWRTAVQYQMFHSLALLALASANPSGSSKWLHGTCWSWVAGIVVFSGSLYLLVITGMAKLGMVTPVGGVGFLLGWLLLIIWLIKDSGPRGRKQ